MEKRGFVYILTNSDNGVLYTGVTCDLEKEMSEHKLGLVGGFAEEHEVDKLIYFEAYDDVVAALEREKQIKARSLDERLDLIDGTNPGWLDLTGRALK